MSDGEGGDATTSVDDGYTINRLLSVSANFFGSGGTARNDRDGSGGRGAAADDYVWYFSYGSNMKRSVFEGRRKIYATDTELATIPGRVLSYAYDGYPYLEPCFATCLKREELPESIRTGVPDVHGVAYRITKSQLKACLATEGGNGWNDAWVGGYGVEEVDAISYEEMHSSYYPNGM